MARSKTKIAFIPFLLLAILVGSGCSSVRTTHPLSSASKPIDKEKFEGAWLPDDGDQPIHVKFTDNGIAKLATLEWEDGEFRLDRGEAIVTKGKHHNFLSLRLKEADGEWDGYYFVPYKFTEKGDLILWTPDVKAFEKMVESNKLEGIITQGEYATYTTITSAPESLLKIIDTPDSLEIFYLGEQLILKKIAADDYKPVNW